jgi:hypothetical protein
VVRAEHALLLLLLQGNACYGLSLWLQSLELVFCCRCVNTIHATGLGFRLLAMLQVAGQLPQGVLPCCDLIVLFRPVLLPDEPFVAQRTVNVAAVACERGTGVL